MFSKKRNPEFFAKTLAKRSLFVLTLLEGWTFSFHVEIRESPEKFPPDTGLKYISIEVEIREKFPPGHRTKIYIYRGGN